MLCWSKKKLETTSILNLNSKLLQEDFNCFCWTNETVSESTGSSVWFLLLLKFITGLTSYQIKLLIYFHSGVQTTTLGKALKQSFCMVVFCSQPSNRPEVSWGGFKDSVHGEVSCWWWLRFWGFLLIWCYMTGRETPDTTSTCVSTVSTFNHLSGTFTFCSFCPGQREHTPSVSMKRWTIHQLHNSWTWVASDWDGVFL